MRPLTEVFSDHPKSNDMTYFEHMRFALSLSVGFLIIGVLSIVHAIFPFLFKDYASSFAEEVHHTLNVNKYR